MPTYIGEDFAQRNNMYFMETSAKEADNVEKLFMEIAHALIEQAKVRETAPPVGTGPSLNLNNNTPKTTSSSDGCCSRL